MQRANIQCRQIDYAHKFRFITLNLFKILKKRRKQHKPKRLSFKENVYKPNVSNVFIKCILSIFFSLWFINTNSNTHLLLQTSVIVDKLAHKSWYFNVVNYVFVEILKTSLVSDAKSPQPQYQKSIEEQCFEDNHRTDLQCVISTSYQYTKYIQ